MIPDITVVDTITGQISIKSYGIRYQFFRVCAEKGGLVLFFVFMIPKRQEVMLNRMILVPTGQTWPERASMTENEKKLLQAKHRLEEAQARDRVKQRKSRTRRLIQEGAILEKALPQTMGMDLNELETYLYELTN